MEYLAQITNQQWLNEQQIWKYNFLDIETKKEDYFYHDKKIEYKPHLVGKLKFLDDKYFHSFQQEIISEEKKITLTQTYEELVKKVERDNKNFLKQLPSKQRKISIGLEHLYHLRKIGFSYSEIATVYKKSERTIFRWFKPTTEPLQKRGVKPIITEEVINLVRSYTLENVTKTQQEVTDYVNKKLNISISRPSITVLLNKLGITHKKLTFHYNQLDEERAKEFNEEIKPLLKEHVFLALDECSFYPNQDPRYGYSLKGERTKSKKPSCKGKHYTLLFAISNLKEKGVIHWKLTDKKVNWEVFTDFLEEINPIGDKKNILLMDNSRVHTAFKKRKQKGLPTIEEQMIKKNIEVRFITAYAPMLNPTELVFCLLRQQTEKKRPRNYEEMELAIKKVVDLLNTKDLSKYFWHCVTYFDRKESKTKLKITDI